MAFDIQSIEINALQLGSDARRSANAYFRDFDLDFTTADSAQSLRELMSGARLRIRLSSIELPEDQNNWRWEVKDGDPVPIAAHLKQQLFSWYRDYLDLELLFENPRVTEHDEVIYTLADGKEFEFHYARNPGVDDPLRFWGQVDITELPGIGPAKNDQWQSYERDADGHFIGFRNRWDEENFIEGKYDEATGEWEKDIRNPLGLFLSGYSIMLSFTIRLHGENAM